MAAADSGAADAGFAAFSATVTEGHLEELARRRIYTRVKDSEPGWLRPGMRIGFKAPVLSEPYSAIRVGPRFFSIGAFGYSRSSLPGNTRVGRYCAIADNVSVMGIRHPIERLSVSGFDYSDRTIFTDACADFGVSFPRRSVGNREGEPIEIGHDVWIGEGALLARGIRIGTGAVIAARAIVTRDVPAYAVVAGSPAQMRKMRFAPDLCDRLLQTEWWRYRFTDFAGMKTTDPAVFCAQFQDRRAAGTLTPWEPDPVALHGIFRPA